MQEGAVAGIQGHENSLLPLTLLAAVTAALAGISEPSPGSLSTIRETSHIQTCLMHVKVPPAPVFAAALWAVPPAMGPNFQ